MKYTNEYFIDKSKKIHDDKYNYSLVDYINSKTKVKIICPIHGIFEQIPDSHLHGRGCNICNGGVKLIINEFIKKSNDIHENKYDYSLVDYINCHTKVNIICPIHGVFEQIPSSHLNGNGCPKCFFNKNSMERTFTLNKIINMFNQIHSNKYNYSLVDYIGINMKVKIICSIHGIFEQTPSKHTIGQGCPKCVGKRKTTDDFIRICKNIHGDKYDYSLVKYINNYTKIKIICPSHGIFNQTPANHTHIKLPQGCPSCCDSKNERFIKKELEHHNIQFESQKTFDGCIYKRKLKFDFYLTEHNICIEYDGEQYDTMYRFEKDDKRLKIRQLRDKIKTDYCLKNNIKLIRIKYNDNIVDKLKSELFCN